MATPANWRTKVHDVIKCHPGLTRQDVQPIIEIVTKAKGDAPTEYDPLLIEQAINQLICAHKVREQARRLYSANPHQITISRSGLKPKVHDVIRCYTCPEKNHPGLERQHVVSIVNIVAEAKGRKPYSATQIERAINQLICDDKVREHARRLYSI